jgi:hypothetical protein
MANLLVGHCKIENIMHDANSGQLKIPQFQRKYVWSVKDCAKLLDSILKGYPVGALIYWKTKETLRVVRNIGNFNFPSLPADDYAYYVLDGQQRITSIIASLTGQKIEDDDYSNIYVNLNATEDDQIVTEDIDSLTKGAYIALCDLYTFDIAKIMIEFNSNSTLITKINEYHNRIKSYEFSKVDLTDAPLAIATEVFTRINTSGKSLSIFEIMCAKMYSETPEFDLYDNRQDQINAWQIASYESIPDTTVLQAMSACLCKSCKGADILALDKDSFIAAWPEVSAAFDLTIDYFKNTFGIPVSKLVPYDALYVPFVYYFYKKKQRPTGNAQKYLKDYFWRATFSTRFTEGAVAKINQDITNVIDVILAGNQPKYDQGLVITKDSITRNGTFSTGSAYVKGILCILCAQNPVSFIDGSTVTIDNSWLSQSNSKNYHHFFPKDYMKKKQPLISESLVNHVVNITIVDGWLNKVKIKAKSPAEYMAEFSIVNPNLADNMKTHLITDIASFGIPANDYNVFFESRIKAIHAKMTDLLIPQANDDFTF